MKFLQKYGPPTFVVVWALLAAMSGWLLVVAPHLGQ